MAQLYQDPTYLAFVEAMRKDPSVAGILADWLEEPEQLHYNAASLAANLRLLHPKKGRPWLKELDDGRGDWPEVFDYANGTGGSPKATPPGSSVSEVPFDCADVCEIIACQDGENDGPDWVMVGRLWDGRFFSIRAGCDYTGWG